MSTYRTQGSCSREIIFNVNENSELTDVKFLGGCSGNLQGIGRLVKGMKIDDIIDKFTGIRCRNGTSCPDQLAKALIEYKKNLDETIEESNEEIEDIEKNIEEEIEDIDEDLEDEDDDYDDDFDDEEEDEEDED